MASEGKKTPGNLRAIIASTVVVAAVTGLSVAAHVWGENRLVSEVRVEGNALLSERAILKRSGITSGTGLFDVDLFAVRRRLLEDPFVKDAEVRRDAPGAVLVTVMERVPVAAIASVPMRLVDRDGWVMPLVLSGRVIDVPVISGHLGLTDVTPGKQAASPALERGIEMAVVLQQMYSANGRISEIHLTEAKEIILLTAEGGIPVLAGHDRLEEKIRSFDAFWKQVVMRNDSQHLRLIDVRYQGQVIAKWHQAGQAKG